MRKLVGMSLAVVLTVFLAFGTAFADSLPSSKVTVALGDLMALGVKASSSTENGSTEDTGWITVLQNFIKMPNQKDLCMDVALQCGLVTDTTVKSVGGERDISEAKGSIRVRVKVTHPDGSFEYALPLEEDNPDLGVTYCYRLQRLEAKFAGLNCTAGLDGVVTCTEPEELRLLLETLSAHAFNFYMADVSPGIHKIEVQARAQTGADLVGSELGKGGAEAFVGLGSMCVHNSRLIKGADTGPIVELE